MDWCYLCMRCFYAKFSFTISASWIFWGGIGEWIGVFCWLFNYSAMFDMAFQLSIACDEIGLLETILTLYIYISKTMLVLLDSVEIDFEFVSICLGATHWVFPFQYLV